MGSTLHSLLEYWTTMSTHTYIISYIYNTPPFDHKILYLTSHLMGKMLIRFVHQFMVRKGD